MQNILAPNPYNLNTCSLLIQGLHVNCTDTPHGQESNPSMMTDCLRLANLSSVVGMCWANFRHFPHVIAQFAE
jgi:hypothetical protein